MKSLILYYSRTGATAKIASALGTALGAEIAEIKCPRYRPGGLRYLLAGYDSLKGRLPPIDVPDVSLKDYDLILFGAPIWTSYPAVPLRSYLAQARELTAHIGLFFAYGGHSPPEKAVEFASDLLPMPLAASLAIPQDQVVEGRYSDAVDAFIAKLTDLDD